jgi:hypothetical protein
MLSVIYAECRKQGHYAECYYDECCYDECCYAECHLCLVSFMLSVVYAECRLY